MNKFVCALCLCGEKGINIEHLAQNDANPVAITRYDDIPDDALDARTFRVDLKKCNSLKVCLTRP